MEARIPQQSETSLDILRRVLCSASLEMRNLAFVEKQPVTGKDYLFRFACVLHGIQSGRTHRQWFKNLAWMLLFMEFVIFSSSWIAFSYLREPKPNDNVSLINVALISNGLIVTVNILYTVFSVLKHNDEVEAQLRRQGRRLRDLGIPLAGMAVHLSVSAQSSSEPELLGLSISYMMMDLSTAVFFMVYADITSSLKESQEHILALLTRPYRFEAAVAENGL